MDVISGLIDVEYAEAFGVEMSVNYELLEFLIRSFDGAQLDKLLHSVGDANIDVEELALDFCRKDSLVLFD